VPVSSLPATVFAARVNRGLDALPRPAIRTAGRPRASFQVLGLTGLFVAIILTHSLTLATGRAFWVMTAITTAAAVTFLALATAAKVVIGEERLVYYHHEIAVLLVTTGLLSLLDRPILPYLDLTVLGVGTFLVFGRIGCFLVGCCHGRPHPYGVRYADHFAQAGVDQRIIGARLLPTQLAESILVLVIVHVGVLMVIRGQPAGSALAWYLVAYDLVRFALEFLRGDTGRPYLGGFSQAQWIAMFLTVVVAVTELAGGLPSQTWHLMAALVLIAAMAGLAARRRLTVNQALLPRHHLLDANHVHELAAALDTLATSCRNGDGAIRIARTPVGLALSRGELPTNLHYTISGDRGLDRTSARTLARLIQQLRHTEVPAALTAGTGGTYHLMFAVDGSRHK
jgi:hypothetical protein